MAIHAQRPHHTDALLAKRIAGAQIDALFGAVNVAVSGAAVAACILAATLNNLGAATARDSAEWALYVFVCALAHVGLCHSYRRSAPIGDLWRGWAFLFTAIALAEGLGWGIASIGLTTAGHDDGRHLIIIIVAGIAAGSLPGFCSYLPAFFALFVPTISGALIASFTATDPIMHAAFPLILVFTSATGALGIKGNRSFKQLVTLRLQTESLAEDLQKQKDIAERANLAKSTFLAAASHDLRQPVHALGMLVGALRGIRMPTEGQDLLEQIEASTNAMDGLFSALLDISRLDAGTVEVHRRPFLIGRMLERVCNDHSVEAKMKGVMLILKPCSLIVDCDPLLVERIVRNLIANAVRYTQRGRIVVGCRRRLGAAAIEVWDTGPGIPPDQHEQVFQEYYQLGNLERDRAKGLGLGLAIVRRLTDLLDCRLTLRSRPGRGSCFAITIPIAGEISEANELEPEELSGALAQGLIVVVDDELSIRDAMKSLLTGWGHDVITAGSGDEIMQRLSSCPVRPDLIICDYRLRDGEHGIAVIERLRLDYNEAVPAVLITGDTAPDRLAEAQRSGLLLLHKPVSNSKLRAAIIHLMASAAHEMEPLSVR